MKTNLPYFCWKKTPLFWEEFRAEEKGVCVSHKDDSNAIHFPIQHTEWTVLRELMRSAQLIGPVDRMQFVLETEQDFKKVKEFHGHVKWNFVVF